nr:coadhesin-like isoform X3 [Crassostrea virginica]
MSSEIVLCLLLTTLITESIQQTTSSPAPVNGGWTPWTDSGSCSVTCGKGSIFRLRFCTNPRPQHGGKNCQGVPYERQECQKTPCPVDGNWSPWKQDSSCSATCGLAFRTSTRECDHPPPQYGGKPCEGNSTDTERCRELPLCAVDGQWGAWSGFSNCSVKCGNGTKTRTRSCDNPAPQYGGLKCAGNESEAVACSASDCAVDGGWSAWISSGRSCSVTCGRGSVIRIRSCTNPTPSNGGQDCSGAPFQSFLCEQPECPVDGGWSRWTSYTPCSATCGVGYQTSTRTCDNPSPQFGGRTCSGENNDTRKCPNLPLCPVDGGWSSWKPNSTCSASCGTALRSLTRECNHPTPQYGGKQCEGNSTDTEPCSGTPPCPIDGGWSSWKPNSSCSASCGTALRTRIRECNHPTPQYGGKQCEGNSTDTEPCSDIPPCPITILTTLSKENSNPTTVHEQTNVKTTVGTSTIATEITFPITSERTSIKATERTSTKATEKTSSLATEMMAHTSPKDQTFPTSIPSITSTSTRSQSVTSPELTVQPERSSSTLQLHTSREASTTIQVPTSKSPGDVTKPQIGLVSVAFVIFIDKSFDDKLLDQTSAIYQETQKMVLEVLTERFKNTPGFVKVELNSFSYGSIRVNYSVGLSGEAVSTAERVRSVKDLLLNKATQWTPNEPVFAGFPVSVLKTKEDAKTLDLSTLLVNERNAACSCPQHDFRCDFRYGDVRCVHLCADLQCGKHGSCYVDIETKAPKCFCEQSENSKVVYFGVNCEKTRDVSDEGTASRESDSMTYIGVSAGVGGGLFLFILISVFCVCRKIQEQKKTRGESIVSYSNGSHLSLDRLEHNKQIKQNFYTNSTHNPVYQETDDVKLRPNSEQILRPNSDQILRTNSEQILRIFVHVDPDERKRMSVGSLSSYHINEEEQVELRQSRNLQTSEDNSNIPVGNESE